jgi:P27 family predicted phage terminase small subunit
VRQLHGDRAAGRDVPQPAPGRVERPAMSEAAGETWDRLAPDLEAKGLLTFWDVDAFQAYCDAVAVRDGAQGHLDREGAVVEQVVIDRHGEATEFTKMVKNPWQLVWNDANALLLRYASRFGLTPADRASVRPTAAAGDGGLEPERLLS